MNEHVGLVVTYFVRFPLLCRGCCKGRCRFRILGLVFLQQN